MIDTHCHLTHRRIADDADDAIARARDAGVTACMTIGTGIEDARNCRALADRHPGYLFCSAGLDPFSAHELGDGFDAAVDALDELLAAGGYSALGEIGLDYHYDLDPRPLQAERFERQLELAQAHDLPVVIHVRDAHDDMAAILAAHPDNRGVIHSFTGGVAEAERYLQLGWYLSLNGVLTFKNAQELRKAAVVAPSERLLVETDSPYLAPVPHRGKRCEPAYVANTLAELARLCDVELQTLDSQTSENARRLFGF